MKETTRRRLRRIEEHTAAPLPGMIQSYEEYVDDPGHAYIGPTLGNPAERITTDELHARLAAQHPVGALTWNEPLPGPLPDLPAEEDR
jgi:hypothetical protein